MTTTNPLAHLGPGRRPAPAAAAGAPAAATTRPARARPTRPSPRATPALPQGDDPVQLDPADFQPGSDNRYFPLEPGTQWTYRETDGEGTVQDVVVTVTSETRKIANGIEARVVRDTVSEDGQVTEDTFDWYAQDGDGNVWYLGEDTAEFENGKVSSREGSFEAGVDGALPGIIMPADPAAGMAYRQEYYPGQAEDNGAVLADRPAGRGRAGPLRRRPAQRRLERPRTGRPRVQALRTRRRARPHAGRLRRIRPGGAAVHAAHQRRGRARGRDRPPRRAVRVGRLGETARARITRLTP